MGKRGGSNHEDRIDKRIVWESENTVDASVDFAAVKQGVSLSSSNQPWMIPTIAVSIVILVVVVLVSNFDSASNIGAVDRQAASSEPQLAQGREPPAEPSAATVDPAGEATSELELVEVFPAASPEITAGLVAAWVSKENELVVVNLETLEIVETPDWTDHLLPPLPAHATVIGAANTTFVVDRMQPERSGRMANSVHLTRLEQGKDSYAFVTEIDDSLDLYVGSLWGAADSIGISVSSSAAVFSEPDKALYVAGVDGTSARLTSTGLEPLPTRLGRLVAVNGDFVAGVHCDDLARCVGRVIGRDTESVFDAQLGARSVVRISNDGDSLVAAANDGNTVVITGLQVDTGTTRGEERTSIELVTSINKSAGWLPDGEHLAWFSQNRILVLSTKSGETYSVPTAFDQATRPARDSRFYIFEAGNAN